MRISAPVTLRKCTDKPGQIFFAFANISVFGIYPTGPGENSLGLSNQFCLDSQLSHLFGFFGTMFFPITTYHCTTCRLFIASKQSILTSMNVFEAIILGLIQGLTEFIPVSSSGHLLLGHEILGNTESTLGFDVALHVGTLLALIIFFSRDIVVLLKNVLKQNSEGRLARLLLYATVPAMIAGLLLSDYIDEQLRSPIVVAIMLAVVGIIMIFADKMVQRAQKEVSLKNGLLIGLAQTAALIPGVSRSGATITTGILLGLERKQAARFSFLLAMPIVAGSALGLVVKGESLGSTGNGALAFGMIAAFASGLFAIRFMLRSIAKLGLKPFAYYRIALAVVVLLTQI